MIITYLEWMAGVPMAQAGRRRHRHPAGSQVLDEDHFDLEKVKDVISNTWRSRSSARSGPSDSAPSSDGGRAARSRAAAGLSGEPAGALEPISASWAAGRGEDESRPEHRPGPGSASSAYCPSAGCGTRRRSWPPADLHGRLRAGSSRSLRRAGSAGSASCRRDRQDRGRLARRSVLGLLEVLDPARDHSLRGQLPGRRVRPVAGALVHRNRQIRSRPSRARCWIEWKCCRSRVHRRGEDRDRSAVPGPEALARTARGARARRSTRGIRQIVRGTRARRAVRSLEREIATVGRKVARRLAEGHREQTRITTGNLVEYLGRPRFFDEVAERTTRPGVATRTGVDADRRRRPVRRGHHDAEQRGAAGPHGHAGGRHAGERPGGSLLVWSNAEALDVDPRSSRARPSTSTCRRAPLRRMGPRPA